MLALPSHSRWRPSSPTPAERLVERPVELQHRRREDADDDRRVDGGEEHRRAEEAPAGHPTVDRERDDQRDDELDRHREREDRVVPQRAAEDRVVQEQPEVVHADPLCRRDPVPARERVVEDAPERIGDEDRRRGRPRAPRRGGPTPNCGLRGHLRASSTVCELSGVQRLQALVDVLHRLLRGALTGERRLELLVVEERFLQRNDAVQQGNLPCSATALQEELRDTDP